MTRSQETSSDPVPDDTPAPAAPDEPWLNPAPCVTVTLRWPTRRITQARASAGVAVPAVLGQTPLEVWPDYATPLAALLRHVAETALPMVIHAAPAVPGGPPMVCSCAPLPNRQGTVRQLLLTMTNADFIGNGAASRTVAETARREEAVRHLLDALPASILWINQDFTVRYHNHFQVELAGYAVGERLPLDSDTPHPRWRRPEDGGPMPWRDLPVARTLATGQPHEAVLLATDGTAQSRYVLFSVEPTFDARRQITGAISINIEMTEQYLAQRHARHSAAVLDLIIESIADGVTIYDADGQTIRYNRAAKRMLGFDETTEVSVIAAYFTDNAHVAQRDGAAFTPHFRQVAEALARRATTAAVDARLERPGGDTLIVRSRAAPLIDPLTGTVLGAVGIMHDLTEMYAVDRLKDEFISIAGHELNTPITTQMLALRLLERAALDATRAQNLPDLVERIKAPTMRLRELVSDMLDLSSIVMGTLAMRLAEGDLAAVLLAAVEEARERLRHPIITVGLAEPSAMRLDAPRLRQCFVNILANAIKYSPPVAPVELRLTLTATGDAHVTVRDQGQGIVARHLPHLFERFYRAADSDPGAASRRRDGLGLGLAIAQAIVAGHGGRIWAESQPERGTLIHVVLPRHLTEADYGTTA